MTTWPDALHLDSNGLKTSASRGDPGDGTTQWFQWSKSADGGLITVGAMADAAVTGGATTGSMIALLKGLQAVLGVSTDAAAPTGNATAIPILKSIRDTLRTGHASDATPVRATSGVVAAAVATATLAAVASKTNYVTGFDFTAGGATAASIVTATLTGLLGGTVSYIVAVPAGATLGVVPMFVRFARPIPASAVNTAISFSVPSLGVGNTGAVANIHGFYL